MFPENDTVSKDLFNFTCNHQDINYHLRKPSSFTEVEAAAGPASENTSTKRLPALVEEAPIGAAERIPRRSADGEGVDWKTRNYNRTRKKMSVYIIGATKKYCF